MTRTVLVVHPSVELYGADRMLVQTVVGFSRAGWRCVVVLPGAGPLVEPLEVAGARVLLLDTPVLRKSLMSFRGAAAYALATVRALPRLTGALREVGPDVVYVSTLTVPVWLAVARWRGLPVVCHVREAEDAVPGVVRRALVVPLLLAGVVVTNSRASREVLLSQVPALSGRTRVVYNGFAGPVGVVGPREVLVGPVRLVLVGRVSWRKGTDVAVAAVALLVASGVDVTLDVVGGVFPGYEWFLEQVREQAVRSGVADRVRWCGVSPQPWEAMAAADVVLVPSRLEPFGNTAVEAMLARRPVVVSRVQGLQEIVVAGVSGELVQPGDAGELAAAVRRVVADWPAARERTEVAARQAAERFGPDRYDADMVSVLDGLAPRAVARRSSA